MIHSSYSIRFLRFLLGLAPAFTGLTKAETALVAKIAQGAKQIAEIGVFEGATSRVICKCTSPQSRLVLVDPYPLSLFAEKVLGFSFAGTIARVTVRPWKRKVTFVRGTSAEVAKTLPGEEKFDFIFIDADHSYEAVREDFQLWASRLTQGGKIGLHDSRCCIARSDLGPEAGPVRLVEELRAGDFGPWKLVEWADTLTVFSLQP